MKNVLSRKIKLITNRGFGISAAIETAIIRELVKTGIKTSAELMVLKRKFAKQYHLSCPKNSALLSAYHKLLKEGKIRKNGSLERFLRTKKVRSLSGIVSVSVLTKPAPCPGKCLYCPTQENLPKSYLDGEPAVMRALANNFDPYLQVKTRLQALEATGHNTSKIELIIIGGTWSSLPTKYQTWFIKECFRACNEYGGQKARNQKLLATQKINEKANRRIIGITIETRPDFINEPEIKKLRILGITRVELGVQSLYNSVLKKNLRGHGIDKTILATRLLKDAGFKICYHMMPNLPGSDFRKDEQMFVELFNNPDFQPDFLKIYPCVVVKEAPLYKFWLKGKYRPYNDRQLIDLLVKVKQKIPIWCRIIRIYRDIPSIKIMAGSKISNLRQVVVRELKKQGKKCLCIRCREVRSDFSPRQKLKLFRQDYAASEGKEIFLTFEDQKRQKLFALLRLRLPETKEVRPPTFDFPVLKDAALMREVHTYGETIGFDQKTKTSPQHRSLGKELIRLAEKIAKEEGFKKMAVISGIGSRNYYRMLGYKLKDTYMVKKL